jgi:hypothetical protein
MKQSIIPADLSGGDGMRWLNSILRRMPEQLGSNSQLFGFTQTSLFTSVEERIP